MKKISLGFLGLLVVTSSSVLPLYARDDVDIRKVTRVAWYALETVSGYILLKQLHANLKGNYWPCAMIDGVWSAPEKTIPYGLGGYLLFMGGLRGLDQELHMVKKLRK